MQKKNSLFEFYFLLLFIINNNGGGHKFSEFACCVKCYTIFYFNEEYMRIYLPEKAIFTVAALQRVILQKCQKY